jgi:hypothetical protein
MRKTRPSLRVWSDLTPAERAVLDRFAQQEDLSLSQVVRRALRQYPELGPALAQARAGREEPQHA